MRHATKKGMIIFPNPVDNILHVISKDILMDNLSFELFNTLGQAQTLSMTKEENQFTIDMAALPSGVYILKMKNGEEVYGYEVIKK